MDLDRALSAAQDLAVLRNRKPAIELIERILEREPDHVEALVLYSEVHAWSGDYERATAIAERAVGLAPDDAEALLQLAWCRWHADRDDEAAGLVRRVLVIEPELEGAWSLDFEMALHAGRKGEALEAAYELLELDPDEADHYARLGYALVLNGDTDEARDAFEEALRLEPDHTRARNGLGALAMTSDDRAAALAHFYDAKRVDPDFDDDSVEQEASYGELYRGVTWLFGWRRDHGGKPVGIAIAVSVAVAGAVYASSWWRGGVAGLLLFPILIVALLAPALAADRYVAPWRRARAALVGLVAIGAVWLWASPNGADGAWGSALALMWALVVTMSTNFGHVEALRHSVQTTARPLDGGDAELGATIDEATRAFEACEYGEAGAAALRARERGLDREVVEAFVKEVQEPEWTSLVDARGDERAIAMSPRWWRRMRAVGESVTGATMALAMVDAALGATWRPVWGSILIGQGMGLVLLLGRPKLPIAWRATCAAVGAAIVMWPVSRALVDHGVGGSLAAYASGAGHWVLAAVAAAFLGGLVRVVRVRAEIEVLR